MRKASSYVYCSTTTAGVVFNLFDSESSQTLLSNHLLTMFKQCALEFDEIQNAKKMDNKARVSWIQRITRSENFEVKMSSVILLKKTTGEVVSLDKIVSHMSKPSALNSKFQHL